MSSLTNSSLVGYTGEMQIKRMSNQSTSLESDNELGFEAATRVACKRGMILPFEALAMSFEDVNYFVDMPPVWNLSPEIDLFCDSPIANFCGFS